MAAKNPLEYRTTHAKTSMGSVILAALYSKCASPSPIFWTPYGPTQSVNTAWPGVTDKHGELIFAIPGNDSRDHPFVFSAKLHVPLDDNIGIFGEANLMTPNDSGTVTAFLGMVYYPSNRVTTTLRTPCAPFLPLANNRNFALDVRR